jgi:glucose/arabinose dehydrogenase
MEQIVIAASIIGVAGSAGLLLWNTVSDLSVKSPTEAFARQFVIDPIAEIPFLPTCLAVDDSGNVFVSYFWTKHNATHGGGIIRLTEDSETGSFEQVTVAKSDLLFRSTGLAVNDGNLYVSRSGYHARAEAGKLFYEDSGAVTQLMDLNGDGYFEYYHDILTGIPGARGPHLQHQNNGIAFAPDGSLFVTNGVAGIGLDEHPLAGALLKLSPDFEKVEVFATGFRNPFGITIAKDGEVFLTDNDVEENPGDELNHVIAGEHYGHPFVYPNHPGKDSVGFREPILLGHAPQSNYVGIAYTDSPMLPDEFRDSFYIADLTMDEVVRVRVEPDGDTYQVTEFQPFASIPAPIDIAIAEDGTIYVASRYHQKIFRIRHRDSIRRQGDAS